MEIFVYSRPAVEAMEAHVAPHVVISINCPGEEPASIRSNRAQLGRVNLFFWDMDHVPKDNNIVIKHNGRSWRACDTPEEELCQPHDAKKIVDLIEAHPEAKEIVVHCTAGKSRSAAVAAALHKIFNGSDEPIFGNKRYSPNMRVYRMILEEWYDRHPME